MTLVDHLEFIKLWMTSSYLYSFFFLKLIQHHLVLFMFWLTIFGFTAPRNAILAIFGLHGPISSTFSPLTASSFRTPNANCGSDLSQIKSVSYVLIEYHTNL